MNPANVNKNRDDFSSAVERPLRSAHTRSRRKTRKLSFLFSPPLQPSNIFLFKLFKGIRGVKYASTADPPCCTCCTLLHVNCKHPPPCKSVRVFQALTSHTRVCNLNRILVLQMTIVQDDYSVCRTTSPPRR